MVKRLSAAQELGRKGGKATAKARTPEERKEAARKAVLARWKKYYESSKGRKRD
jgi:hypothetical protein